MEVSDLRLPLRSARRAALQTARAPRGNVLPLVRAPRRRAFLAVASGLPFRVHAARRACPSCVHPPPPSSLPGDCLERDQGGSVGWWWRSSPPSRPKRWPLVVRGHLSLEMWLLQPSFRFRCILVTTETVPRGHSARRGAGSQAATRSLPTLRPSRHRALRVPWRHSLLVSAPYVPGSVQRSSAQGLPWLWRSCVFLSSNWLLGLVGDRFDPSDPRTPAGSAGTPPETRPWPRRPPSLFLHSQTWPSASAGTC